MTRRRHGDANPRGRLERPVGRLRLADGLQSPGDITIEAAQERVYADWERQAAAGTISRACIDGYRAQTRGLCALALARKLTHLDQFDATFIHDWTRLRETGASESEVLPRTRKMRLAAARAFFITAQCLGLHDENPAQAVEAHVPTPRHVRPLSDGQIRQLKRVAPYKVHQLNGRTVPESKTPAALALTLLGASNGENSQVRVRDVDLGNRRVWLHDGGYRSRNRWVPIDDPWCLEAISTRISIIRQTTPAEHVPDRFLSYDSAKGSGTKNQRSAATSDLLTDLMRRAGVYTPGLTRVESIREYVASVVFARTGRVEAVAARLGMSSLDAAAHLVDYDWVSAYDAQIAPPPGESR